MEKLFITNPAGPFSPFFNIRYDAGIISGIEPTGLWVTIHATCENENTCVGCQKRIPSKTAFKLFVKVANPCIYSLCQNVVVKRTMPHKGWTAAFIFGVPLLFAFASLLVWNYISSQTVGSPLSLGVMSAAVLIGFITVHIGDTFFHLSSISASDDFRHTHG